MHEAIAKGPSGNLQGSYKFLCLDTGQKIVRKRWTELPMPSHVIDKVNKMGMADGNLTLQFLDRYKEEYVLMMKTIMMLTMGIIKQTTWKQIFLGFSWMQ